ncbi:ShlB/FhaC/HecB family hemolysin secretion/activation protein [Sphingomonas sp.]|uniref:ShlB/FhaC/HecB family hemolysin secretion/activation protein n=1 Tax=Sphingomonas sp. TaxID=28214 RepID=UPI003CC69409
MGSQRRLGIATTTVSGLALAFAWPAVAGAQTVTPQGNPLPSREEVTPPAPTTAPPATASVDSRAALVQSSCPFETSPIRLTLNRVSFTRPDGSPLQAPVARTLAGVAAPGGDQPIRVICDLRDAANEALRRDGWVASVQIPAQSIETGELKFQVVTARITEIRVRGTPGPYRAALEGRLDQLRSLDPLNEHDAERALLLAGDVPGLDVQLALRPAGTQPGDVIGDLLITYRPYALIGNAQNFNSKALGRETVYVRGELYGLTGLQDVAYVGASATTQFSEQKIVQAGYTFGLGLENISFGPRIIYAWSRPDLAALDLDTRTLITGFDLSAPLRRSLGSNLRIGAGFDFVNQTTSVATGGSAATPLNRDRLRIVFARLSGDLTGRRGDGSIAYSLRGGLEARKGLNIFSATPIGSVSGTGAIPSRVDGNSRATVVRLDLDGEAALSRIFSVAGAVRAQYANDPLLNYEEFSLGNLTIGRGYDPGSNSGDRAVGVRGELIAHLPLNSTRFDTQVFGFYDSVWLTNLDRNSTEVDRHLRSFGGGLRAIFANQVSVEAMYAHPQDRALTIDKTRPPNRFLISITARFDPRAR